MKLRAAGRLVGLMLVGACSSPPPPAPYPVVFLTVADPGEPLAGVVIHAGGAQLVSDASGVLATELRGPDGTTLPVEVTCPDGHRLASPPPPLVLRRAVDLTSGMSAALRVSIECPPLVRHGVVVVRAGGEGVREGIPVLVDGAVVAHTDRSGVAHAVLSGTPGSHFVVQLATSSVLPALRPIDPLMPFSFGDGDEVFVFDRELTTEMPPPVARRRARRPRAPPAPAPVHRPERL